MYQCLECGDNRGHSDTCSRGSPIREARRVQESERQVDILLALREIAKKLDVLLTRLP